MTKATGKVTIIRQVNGKDGRFTEFRFNRNQNRYKPPEIDRNKRDIWDNATHSGWSTNPWYLHEGEVQWMVKATIQPDGSELGQLVGQWSEPVCISGDDGEVGASPIFLGQWSAAEEYTGNKLIVHIVRYKGKYYMAQKVGTFSGADKSPENKQFWKEFGGNFRSVATELLLAEKASIANFIFNGTSLRSANGTLEIDGKNGVITSLANGLAVTISPNGFDVFATQEGNNSGFKMGIDADGCPVLQYFDKNGELAYDLGPKGISKLVRSNGRWELYRLIKVQQGLFVEAPQPQDAYKYYSATDGIGAVKNNDVDRMYFITKDFDPASEERPTVDAYKLPNGWYADEKDWAQRDSWPVQPNNNISIIHIDNGRVDKQGNYNRQIGLITEN